MPLTALLRDVGALDATLPDLGGAATWDTIHKARPRADLYCRGCGARLQAKVSVRGHRFFAHDAAVSDCPHNGESVSHRLLKTELAAAIRTAGWQAELEVPGTGWRADVLATSPDGQLRFAWEAQLASATTDDLSARTATMLLELDNVCWVTDRDVPWVKRVPSIRIRRDEKSTRFTIASGVARFRPDWCQPRTRCEQRIRVPGPCDGHGSWETPTDLTLDDFVAFASRQQIVVHHTTQWLPEDNSRHWGGNVVWTAPAYITQERHQVQVREAIEKQERQHARNIEALLARQRALVRPATELIYRQTGTYPRAAAEPERPWGMGIPMFLRGAPHAVICPVASRITPRLRELLASMTVIVNDEAERTRVAKVCKPRTRIVVLAAQEGLDPG